MADIVKLRTGYAVSVAIIRTGFAGPPGAGGGSAYDDTAILARVAAVEQSIAALPAPYDDAALAGRVAALEGASVAWTDITGKPAAFPPTTHRHDASQIDNLPAPTWTAITGKPTDFPPAAHSHEISAVTGLQAELDGKQPLTTFKTINGEVITGSGDIIVSGGVAAGASQVFPELSGKVAGIAIPYNQLSAGGAAWFADLGARGVPVVRLDAYWDNIQTTKDGAYNWTALDVVVDGLRANGVHVLLVPNNKPAWASSALTDATDRQACADFCGALAAHYIGRCDNFEIVNEPNKTAITAATYADLLKRAYVAIKKANPLATVISGGLAPTMTNGTNMTRLPEWVDAFFAVPNIGAYFDQFGMHPYTLPYWLSDPEVANSTVENGWSWMVDLIRPRMVAEGLASKPVAITEMGFVSDSDQAFNGAQGQAEAVQEAITASLALPWVSSFFLYSYKDIGGATTNPEHWFGMIDPAGADKPVAAVLQAATHGGYAGAAVPSVPHTHEISDVAGLQTALDGKAPASSIWTQEQLQDLVAAMFQSGTHSNASIVYDDASGSLSITASGGGGASLTEEEVEDFVGGLIVQGTGISVAYDDAGNVLSISLAGETYTTAEKNKLAGIAPGATANAPDAQLRDRSTHTGTQAITTISGLQTALDGKAPTNHSHAISDVAGLQVALTTATDTLAAVQAEIAEARAQLSAVSAFAAPNAGGIVPGRYYDNATTSVANSNYTSAVDRVDMTPFITSRPLRVDQIGFAVVTAGSAAYGRAFVYGCGADGWPSDLLFEGATDLDLNSANFRGHTLASPITFEANRVYWVGWRFGAATTYAVLRGLNISSAPNLGLPASSSNNYFSVLRRTIPFATRLPTTWGFIESDMAANIAPPSIRMRAT